MANAIIPDGRLVPFPIPERGAPSKYEDVAVNGVRIGQLVEDLTKGKIPRRYDCHLDPDIDEGSLPRRAGWRRCFGQCSASQRHLEKHEVAKGDLFLYFGWFRRVEKTNGRWRYVAGTPDLHVLYGWLRIGRVVQLHQGERPEPEEAFSDHPHLLPKFRKSNTLYVAADHLAVDGLDLPGGGTFRRLADQRILTDTTQRLRSAWKLPGFFHPENGASLSYHARPDRWRLTDTGCLLQAAGRGQEFVLKTESETALQEWLREVFNG